MSNGNWIAVTTASLLSFSLNSLCMGLLPDTQNCGLRMRRECWERFPHHRVLAIPTRITARASRMCRDACRDRLLAVSFEVGAGENVPGIPGACSTRNFAYLERGPLCDCPCSSTAVAGWHESNEAWLVKVTIIGSSMYKCWCKFFCGYG